LLTYQRYQQLARKLGGIGLQITVLVAIYWGIQAWIIRDMSSGPVPTVVAGQVDGNTPLSLPLDAQGPYLIHFWASWCPICGVMEGAVNDVATDYPVIGIALKSGSHDEVRAFMVEHEIDYPVISDANGVISQRFGVTGVPSTFVVDRDNTVRFRDRGLSSEWGLRLRLWLAGRD
jgi:peroxiredoxin